MKDVAINAGVSVASVSHLMNGTRHLSDGVTRRIEEAIRDLKFKPNPVARNLRAGKSGLIGFIIPNAENYFYISIAKGIEKVSSQYDYQLLMVDSAERKEKEKKHIESLFMGGADGLIIVPTSPDCGYLNATIRPDYPIVFVDRQSANYEADTILLSNFEAAYNAAKIFISRNKKRLGFLAFHFGTKEIDKTMQERIDGFQAALKDTGLSCGPEFIKAAPGGVPATINELVSTQSYKMMEQLLDMHVEGVLCGNSLAAVGAFSCLKEKKIQIPEQVAIITFDDEVWIRLTNPSISSVVQPAESMGSLAAQRLIARIRGEKPDYECFRLKSEIVIRES